MNTHIETLKDRQFTIEMELDELCIQDSEPDAEEVEKLRSEHHAVTAAIAGMERITQLEQQLAEARSEAGVVREINTVIGKERDGVRISLKIATDALEDFRDNWDCDSDSHRYGTPCRCCSAKEAINRIKGA